MGSVRAAIAGRFVLALAIGALVLLPGSASAQFVAQSGSATFNDAAQVTDPLFEQYDDCTGLGPASQQFPDYGDAVLQSADDFNVSGTHTLNQVIAIGSGTDVANGTVVIEVYDIDGPSGLPGTLLCSEVGLVSTGAGTEVNVTLDGSCELGSGAYWMSVMPNIEFATFGQWFWDSNGNGFGQEFAFRDPDGLLGNPCVDWGFAITDCGNGATFPNLCFGIGELPDTGGGGVPAVGTTGAIVMLLVVMAISFFYLRRRQTA